MIKGNKLSTRYKEKLRKRLDRMQRDFVKDLTEIRNLLEITSGYTGIEDTEGTKDLESVFKEDVLGTKVKKAKTPKKPKEKIKGKEKKASKTSDKIPKKRGRKPKNHLGVEKKTKKSPINLSLENNVVQDPFSTGMLKVTPPVTPNFFLTSDPHPVDKSTKKPS